MNSEREIVVCITGASGAIYCVKTIEILLSLGISLNLIFSENGKKVFEYETDMSIQSFVKKFSKLGKLHIEDNTNMFSRFASGGGNYDVLVCPASMGTLGRVANGVSSTLIERVCDVAIKEKRNVVFVVRESPLSLIHLNNMLTLTSAGAIIMPAAPFFYLKPETIDAMAKQFSERIVKSVIGDYIPKTKWNDNGNL